VIGLRSIGAGLACIVAEAAGATPPLTLRPGGHPFARTVDLPPVDPAATYAVVDEGPGLSGSSFGAVADALQDQGVASGRIVFLPGHAGDLGPQASERHRARWAGARRLHVSFDDLIAPRLPAWFEDFTGPAETVHDLSGGAWRALTHGAGEAAWPPSAAHQERRKFLIRGPRGAVLLKFVGLGDHGLAALRRARVLHDAGLTPEPLGWRHGFLAERWTEGRPLTSVDRPALITALSRLLEVRSRHLPAPGHAGASLDALAAMLRANAAEALGAETAARLPEPPDRVGPRLFVDGRLHAWEWRVGRDGRVFKTDAVDHAAAHDLIGAQPIEWDLAGAALELGVTSAELPALADLHPFWPAAYAAFQLGLWTMAETALTGWPAEAARCGRHAATYAEMLRTRH
jgi:hypothetical protein